MPLALENVQAIEIVNANSYNVSGFMVFNDLKEIHIMYDEGTIIDGVFTKLKGGVLKVKGNDFYAIALSPVDGNKNMYDNLKVILYNKLMSVKGVSGTLV